MSTVPDKEPIVVGLYGISGCGKTYLLQKLKLMLPESDFAFFEGSDVISNLVPGGLEAFKQLSKDDQVSYREQAIGHIKKECASSNRVGIVTGHFMFWRTGSGEGEEVVTPADLATYTHILYLDIPIDNINRNRREDAERDRPWISRKYLQAWQSAEKKALRPLCASHGILFSLVSPSPSLSLEDKASALLHDFREHTPELNLARAKAEIDNAFLPKRDHLKTVLVMDADRTLIAEDTGRLIWNVAHGHEEDGADSLKGVFSGPLGYSYTAFRQATLLYEELAHHKDLDQICRKVARLVTIHPEFVELLRQAAGKPHVGAVVVTSGLRSVWNAILKGAGLSDTVKVIGGGRISDGFVVNAEVKGALVEHLHTVYKVHVSAFGDGPLDLPMLTKADDAIVVVGPKELRSKTMDSVLWCQIRNGLRARQALLPKSNNSAPRLDTLRLPLIQLGEQGTIDALLTMRPLRLLHAIDRTSAKLLMTPTRDASVSGVALRDAHFRVGVYLATELVTEIVGLEDYIIPHVQGHQTTGHRLRNEHRTTIVAILRGGEPMAFGVNAAFPQAMFLHARSADDIKAHHVLGQSNVILVDSVVNNGKTVVEFVEHLARFGHPFDQIVVVAGVVQADAVCEDGPIAKVDCKAGKLSVVALRLSTNKFTGEGTTDTGNRLFNTTHLT
jgi:uracil phosphoribosyltransferase/phosphoserine phosphatase